MLAGPSPESKLNSESYFAPGPAADTFGLGLTTEATIRFSVTVASALLLSLSTLSGSPPPGFHLDSEGWVVVYHILWVDIIL